MTNRQGTAETAGRRQANWKTVSLIAASAIVLGLAAANYHLVHVALQSQPDCMPHLKSAGQDGTYRAARSSC